MPAEVWQYNSAVEVARLFHMRLDFAAVVPMLGRDTYVGGKGTMDGKVFGLVTVAHAKGPETDMSELVTYLNDAALMAPSMLLGPNITFAAVDERSFDLTLVDAAQTVTARVFLDDDWRPVNFSTTDRYADLPGGLVRAEWTTPIHGWQPDGDRFLFTGAAPSGSCRRPDELLGLQHLPRRRSLQPGSRRHLAQGLVMPAGPRGASGDGGRARLRLVPDPGARRQPHLAGRLRSEAHRCTKPPGFRSTWPARPSPPEPG